jgi:hypothetical protein
MPTEQKLGRMPFFVVLGKLQLAVLVVTSTTPTPDEEGAPGRLVVDDGFDAPLNSAQDDPALGDQCFLQHGGVLTADHALQTVIGGHMQCARRMSLSALPGSRRALRWREDGITNPADLGKRWRRELLVERSNVRLRLRAATRVDGHQAAPGVRKATVSSQVNQLTDVVPPMDRRR